MAATRVTAILPGMPLGIRTPDLPVRMRTLLSGRGPAGGFGVLLQTDETIDNSQFPVFARCDYTTIRTIPQQVFLPGKREAVVLQLMGVPSYPYPFPYVRRFISGWAL